jgi:hypothetical protein
MREKIKQVAVEMVETEGLINLSRSGLCKRAGIPAGSFPHFMGCTFSEFLEELVKMDIKSPHGSVSKSRVKPELRKEHILSCALGLAETIGYTRLTREGVAEAAGVSGGLVSQYFSMSRLRDGVVNLAIRDGILVVIGQAIVAKHGAAQSLPAELKNKALAALTEV